MCDEHCAWCGNATDEGHEIAVYDEEDNITGYEIACSLCFGYLLKTLLELV